MRLAFGSAVRCTDAPYGELADVIVDPLSRRVTHLVVAPHRRHDAARLVPIGRTHVHGAVLALDYTLDELEALEPVQESAYLRVGAFPVAEPGWDVGVQSFLAMPVFQELDGMGTVIDSDPHTTVVYDRIPAGNAEIQRTSAVISADGHHLGHVEGFLVDGDAPFADLVLERGHLWGRREVVIPFAAIAAVATDQVTLNLSAHAVGALPARRVHRWF